jgi:hypothetical protein
MRFEDRGMIAEDVPGKSDAGCESVGAVDRSRNTLGPAVEKAITAAEVERKILGNGPGILGEKFRPCVVCIRIISGILIGIEVAVPVIGPVVVCPCISVPASGPPVFEFRPELEVVVALDEIFGVVGQRGVGLKPLAVGLVPVVTVVIPLVIRGAEEGRPLPIRVEIIVALKERLFKIDKRLGA